MRFAALDVETANADMASICSIGVATFDSGQLVDEWYSLVDPRDYFDEVMSPSTASLRGTSRVRGTMRPSAVTLPHGWRGPWSSPIPTSIG